ncbi:VOC family protein [Nocardia sp. NPDC051756]|uniref:VOC family protein n=1 Tax=Nocardia sp. NPDC051756 TaxID=3154751 RepID=UPI003425274C
MDALHPRLLVTHFAECFTFYAAVLPDLIGANLIKGTPEGPYANWDVDNQAALILFDRTAMAKVAGTTTLPTQSTPTQDTVMFVCRVKDVDTAHTLCLQNGATPVTAPTNRPDWSPNLRTAHLRDPAGTLIELQSY